VASSSKNRTSFMKMNRERELAEKRARKQEKKDAKRQAARADSTDDVAAVAEPTERPS
jgi:hypothetical protein